MNFDYAADGSYEYTLDNFAAGDVIDLPDLDRFSVVDDDFTDGIIQLDVNNGSGKTITVTLTGVDHAIEGHINSVADFNAQFGAGSLI